MNWNEKNDGEVILPTHWMDIWEELHPGESGFTYDGKLNLMVFLIFFVKIK